MKKISKYFVVITLISLFFTVQDAYAHRPEEGNEEGLTIIPDISTSYAYYRELYNPGEVHIYQFEGKAGEFFHVGVNIPKLDGLEDFGVALALLGPGLPNVDRNTLPLENAQISKNEQEVRQGLIAESKKTGDFYEPFTQTEYWGRQQIELDLPESGTYTLLVWNERNRTGKYVLDTGFEEVFGMGDLFRFPIWWLNTRLYFEQGASLILMGMLVPLGITGIFFIRKKIGEQGKEES